MNIIRYKHVHFLSQKINCKKARQFWVFLQSPLTERKNRFRSVEEYSVLKELYKHIRFQCTLKVQIAFHRIYLR